MNNEQVIIGGGVTGATVGVVLRLLNIPTRIVCRHWLEDIELNPEWLSTEPRFASQYPAASVIPHSVEIDNKLWHVRVNRILFNALVPFVHTGVRRQHHYEIFESPTEYGADTADMPQFSPLPNDGSGSNDAPRRLIDVPIFGWSFQVLFAEMQIYRRFLGQLYRRLGGSIDNGRFVSLSDIVPRPVDTVINCGGAWGPALTGDQVNSRFVKGTLVRVNAQGALPRSRFTNEICSYNYHPVAEVYSNANGTPADVYFYPRSDGWLLGGTRLESEVLDCKAATLSEQPPSWRGEVWSKKAIEVPLASHLNTEQIRTTKVPAPLIELNRTLVNYLTGDDLARYPMTAMTGYRHKRETVRLDESTIGPLRVLHNYGHGGAGVTLSWSCAIAVASKLLRREVSVQEVEELLRRQIA